MEAGSAIGNCLTDRCTMLYRQLVPVQQRSVHMLSGIPEKFALEK